MSDSDPTEPRLIRTWFCPANRRFVMHLSQTDGVYRWLYVEPDEQPYHTHTWRLVLREGVDHHTEHGREIRVTCEEVLAEETRDVASLLHQVALDAPSYDRAVRR